MVILPTKLVSAPFFPHDAIIGEYVFSSVHNSSFTPEFATFFGPFYFVIQEASVAPRVLATK
jgi:hypothetical protein